MKWLSPNQRANKWQSWDGWPIPSLADNLVIVIEGKTHDRTGLALCDLEPGLLIIHFSLLYTTGTWKWWPVGFLKRNLGK